MRRLPLFVLPTVLYPGMVMPLHVFEPRYRRMAARCLEADKRFGLLYHDEKTKGAFVLTEGRIGGIAEIRQFRPLPDGRSLMLTVGVGRFQVLDGIENDDDYYEAVVDDYEDTSDRTLNMVPRRRESIALLERVLSKLHGAAPEAIDTAHDVSFVLAEGIAVNPSWQQMLLELRSESERLDEIDAVFNAVMEHAGEPPPPE
jgi:Lon protease-like protein